MRVKVELNFFFPFLFWRQIDAAGDTWSARKGCSYLQGSFRQVWGAPGHEGIPVCRRACRTDRKKVTGDVCHVSGVPSPTHSILFFRVSCVRNRRSFWVRSTPGLANCLSRSSANLTRRLLTTRRWRRWIDLAIRWTVAIGRRNNNKCS